ncbi:MAG: helix-turn-helix domain-containing protein [Planctomycetes bacterium]|nr:helix-turn-helix domain-containing protein [Planctomycetota bacterium]
MGNFEYDFSVIRHLRKEKKLSFRSLAAKSGLSLGAVVKIERNDGNPALQTLVRLCKSLDITVSDLLALAERQKPRRAKGRRRTIGKAEFLECDVAGQKLFFGKFNKGHRASSPSIHGNIVETCILLSGKVEVKMGDTVYKLRPRDLLQFDAIFEHEYVASEESHVLIIHGRRGTAEKG